MDPPRRDIARRKRTDKVFALVGLMATLVGMITLLALMIDLAWDGTAATQLDFLSAFPSRFPDKAGILSAWVGTGVVMFVTALAAVPMGVAAGVYLEEYAPKNWITTLIEINIANLAGVPSIVYGLMALGLFVYKFKFGMSVITAGLTLALLILAHRHHGHAGSHPDHPQLHPRSGLRRRRHEMAAGSPPYPSLFRGGYFDRGHYRSLPRHWRKRPAHHHRRPHLHRVPARRPL
jgi:hypothetical protein